MLYTNPRGSTSYGQAFADQIEKDYPGHDYDDLMSAVDAAIATGHVDPDNLFVTGGSGGGVLTAWIVGKTDRFRAAATQKPVIELASFALTTDFAAGFSPGWRKERPWEDPQGYWKYSPLSLVGNVKTPTLVVVGSEDYRTPVSQAEQYYTALQLRGIPTALVKITGREPWRHCRPAEPGGGQGQRDPRLVRPLPHRQADGRLSLGRTPVATFSTAGRPWPVPPSSPAFGRRVT